MKTMDLRLVEIFCRVYETRSHSRAADSLELRQPTVSVHMRALEAEVGTPLFEKRGRRLVPTRAAELLYAHGRRIVASRRAAIEDIDRLLNRYEGELVVGGSTIPGEYILPTVVARYRAAYPAVSVKLRIGDTERTIAALEAGEIELGFVGARRASAHLVFRRFTGDELVLVMRGGGVSATEVARMRAGGRGAGASRGAGAGTGAGVRGAVTRAGRAGRGRVAKPSVISVRELSGLPLVLRESGSGTRATLEARLARCGVDVASLRVVAELGSSNGVKEAVKAGLGATVLSRRAVEAELRSGVLTELRIRECPRMTRDFFVVTDRRRLLSLVASSFLDVALDTVRRG